VATLPRTLADALFTARRPSEAVARPVPAESYSRPNRASWHVVAYRRGVARVVESRATRRQADAAAGRGAAPATGRRGPGVRRPGGRAGRRRGGAAAGAAEVRNLRKMQGFLTIRGGKWRANLVGLASREGACDTLPTLTPTRPY
jgi:hypothetical protein